MQDHLSPTDLRGDVFEVHRLDGGPKLFLNGSPSAAASDHVASKTAQQPDAGRAFQKDAQIEQAADRGAAQEPKAIHQDNRLGLEKL